MRLAQHTLCFLLAFSSLLTLAAGEDSLPVPTDLEALRSPFSDHELILRWEQWAHDPLQASFVVEIYRNSGSRWEPAVDLRNARVPLSPWRGLVLDGRDVPSGDYLWRAKRVQRERDSLEDAVLFDLPRRGASSPWSGWARFTVSTLAGGESYRDNLPAGPRQVWAPNNPAWSKTVLLARALVAHEIGHTFQPTSGGFAPHHRDDQNPIAEAPASGCAMDYPHMNWGVYWYCPEHITEMNNNLRNRSHLQPNDWKSKLKLIGDVAFEESARKLRFESPQALLETVADPYRPWASRHLLISFNGYEWTSQKRYDSGANKMTIDALARSEPWGGNWEVCVGFSARSDAAPEEYRGSFGYANTNSHHAMIYFHDLLPPVYAGLEEQSLEEAGLPSLPGGSSSSRESASTSGSSSAGNQIRAGAATRIDGALGN